MDGCVPRTATDVVEEDKEAMGSPRSTGDSALSDASTTDAAVANNSNKGGPAFDKALVQALSILTPLRNELDDLSAFLAHYKRDNPTPLPPKLAELPGRLKYASTQCKMAHRTLSSVRTAGRATHGGRDQSDSTPRASSPSTPRGSTTPRASSPATPRGSGPATPRANAASSPRAASHVASAPRAATVILGPASVPASGEAACARECREVATQTWASGVGIGITTRAPSPTTTRPTSPRAASPKRMRMPMASRWPENQVQPREPTTQRERAIRDEPSHPLHALYVSAPGCDAHSIDDDCVSVQEALLGLSTLRMLGGAERRKSWLKVVFLEWVVASVGAARTRERLIKKAVARQKTFFSEGKGGGRLHLNRKSEPLQSSRTINPDAERTASPARCSPLRPVSTSNILERAYSLGFPAPKSREAALRADEKPVPAKVASLIHNMHTPFGQ